MEHLSYLATALSGQSGLKYEISSQNWSTDFLRFYHSQTNYNISKDKKSISVGLWHGKKSYSFGIDDPNQDRSTSPSETRLPSSSSFLRIRILWTSRLISQSHRHERCQTTSS